LPAQVPFRLSALAAASWLDVHAASTGVRESAPVQGAQSSPRDHRPVRAVSKRRI
jgi:hypothetical protein